MKTKLVLFSSITNFLFISALHKPLVKIHDGLVRGTILESRNKRNFSAFVGIPYAEPPIGNLRFSDPRRAKPWNGIISAERNVSCVQRFAGRDKAIGIEDCLYLNVFTPVLEFDSSKTKNTFNNRLLPVMVWIHGGGFYFGSADYGPKFLLDKDIVFVLFNYRLGIIGFLSTGDSVAPGNFGMKDQILALKWVQKNIEAFGGDPNKVTIFGESAGGASVSLHTLSDASNGLFHQVIAQSGNALVPWGYRDRSLFKPDVDSIAKNVGCSIENSEIIVKCLREKSATELVDLTSYEVLEFPHLLWIPTNEVESEDAFLTDSPYNLIAKNKMRDYPFMTGIVADEGLYLTEDLYPNSTYQSIKQALDKTIQLSSEHYVVPENEKKFKKIIAGFYFDELGSSSNKDKLLESYTKFAGDTQFIYPNSLLIEKMSDVSKKPFYSYVFGYHGERSFLPMDLNIGVTHADDLFYLFSPFRPKPQNLVIKNDEYIIDVVVDLWTSFAIKGRPISNRLDVPDLWEPYAENKRFLRIGSITNNTDPSVTIQKNLFTDRLNFWKNNFPILGKNE